MPRIGLTGIVRLLVVGPLVPVVVLLVNACGADHPPPVDVDSSGGFSEGGRGNETRPPPFTANCATGDVKECTVYHQAGDVTNCFVGVKLCVDGTWDACTTEENVEARIRELGYDRTEANGGATGTNADGAPAGAGADS